jgi:hypothetical protein
MHKQDVRRDINENPRPKTDGDLFYTGDLAAANPALCFI